MKKTIRLLLVVKLLFSFSPAFADILLDYEDQCAKYLSTITSKMESMTCMKNCLKERDNNFFCEKYVCGDGNICLYTNKDEMVRSERYLEGEKNAHESMIVKSTVILLICAGIFAGTFIYRKRNRKDV